MIRVCYRAFQRQISSGAYRGWPIKAGRAETLQAESAICFKSQFAIRMNAVVEPF